VTEAPSLRIGSIVIDCDDFDAMVRFWSAALGYRPREPATDGWVVLSDPSGRGPNVSINRTREGHLEQYRLHIDLYAADAKSEVARLSSLGARVLRDRQAGEDFVVLGDPDGNPFCVVETVARPA